MIVHFRRKSHASRYCRATSGKLVDSRSVEVPDNAFHPTDVPFILERFIEGEITVELRIPMLGDVHTLTEIPKHRALFLLSKLET
jgi:hypothetical protein